jgi:hypothetical protein
MTTLMVQRGEEEQARSACSSSLNPHRHIVIAREEERRPKQSAEPGRLYRRYVVFVVHGCGVWCLYRPKTHHLQPLS